MSELEKVLQEIAIHNALIGLEAKSRLKTYRLLVLLLLVAIGIMALYIKKEK